MDTHTPYVPAPRHLRAVGAPGMGLLKRFQAHLHTGLGLGIDEDTLEALRSLYRGAVHQVDASVGRLLETLDETGLRDSTAVVVTGDHGEEFQDHGHLAHYPKLYDELVRVPLLVELPGAEPRRVTEPVSHDGLGPTLSAAMGAGTDPFEADSLLPALLEEEAPERSPVTSVAVRGKTVTQQPIPRHLDEGELLVSARDERYTYIHHTDSGNRELYDRDTDPGETADLAGGDAVPEAVVERLHAAVQRRASRIGGDGDDRRETPDALNERLAALGYR
jgi:arylsulfatase A-like enzyme